jgi:hypothetical protein
MKQKLLVLSLLAAGSVFAADLSVGVRIGPPPPPRVVRVRPASPGPDYVWVQGYWYPVGKRYHWHDGYWTRRAYRGAQWVAPRYEGQRYYDGYWEGDRGRSAHDHQWDHDRDRDYRDHDRH